MKERDISRAMQNRKNKKLEEANKAKEETQMNEGLEKILDVDQEAIDDGVDEPIDWNKVTARSVYIMNNLPGILLELMEDEDVGSFIAETYEDVLEQAYIDTLYDGIEQAVFKEIKKELPGIVAKAMKPFLRK